MQGFLNQPLVSVIVPCYNQARFLVDSIGSVLAQTYENYEIIVVDDGSPNPEDQEILKTLHFPRTRVLRKINGGVSSARNFGINVAKGKYILPLDADDKISSNFIDSCVQVLESDDKIGIVGGMTEMFGVKSGILNLPDYSFPYILAVNMLTVTQMYRRVDWQLVGGYNENMVLGYEDWDFWLSIISLGRQVRRLSHITCFYRQQAGSRSENLENVSNNRKLTLRQLVENHSDLYAKHMRHKNFVLTGRYSALGVIARVVARMFELVAGNSCSSVCWKLRHIV